jgi:hypothetical protein
LRRAWETRSRVSQQLGLTPAQTDTAMRYQSATGCSWAEAVAQVRGEREFTQEDLEKDRKMMKETPSMKWNQSSAKVMGRLPD